MGLKEKLLAYKPKIAPVEGREDLDLYVRVMTGAGRYTLEQKIQKMDKHNYLIETALVGACDKEGALAFTEKDRQALNEMPSDLLQDIFTATFKLNKMTAEDVEDEVKPSETTPEGNSGTN